MTKNKEHNEQFNDNISFTGDKRRNIYQVPKNYFETLQHSIEEKIIETDLKELNISKRNIHKIPDQYFSSFEKNEYRINEPKIISLKNWNTPKILKIAASFTVIISIGYLSFLFFNKSSVNDLQTAYSNEYDFSISEYETGLFNDSEDELMASLEFVDNISFDNNLFINDGELTIDELDEYLDSEIELIIEF